uniref:Uncharacterized protein n=1 Tax=Molossus molossus TaxID=27622 RepID=A0A7J8IZH4_MOLMO|nr:hypothetical protein HJG59_010357 [Molossus molossus]
MSREQRAFSNTGITLPHFLLDDSSPGWGPQLSGPRDIAEGANPGSLPYPLQRALGSSLSLGRQGDGTASRIYVRQKEEWPNPWCTTIQAGELLPSELAAREPWLRAGGSPKPLSRPRSAKTSQGAHSWSHLSSPGQSLPFSPHLIPWAKATQVRPSA